MFCLSFGTFLGHAIPQWVTASSTLSLVLFYLYQTS